MRSIGFAATAIVMIGATTAAWADAVVSPENGSFLVSRGQGFVRQVQPADLQVGDRVMVAQGNRAKITYGDGCVIELRPGSVEIIKLASPCGPGSPIGGPGTGLLGSNIAGFGVAGAVVALGTVAAILSFDEKNAPFPAPRPRSP